MTEQARIAEKHNIQRVTWQGKDSEDPSQLVFFDSPHEMVTKCNECYDTGDHVKNEKDCSDDGGRATLSKLYKDNTKESKWRYGSCKTLKATQDLLERGDVTDVVAKQIEKMTNELRTTDAVERLMQQGKTIKRHRKYSMDGSELDIDRVMSGDPDHWSTMTKGKKSSIVRLGVKFSLSCGNAEKQFAQIAALAIVAADILQACGFSVQIVGHSICQYNTRDIYESGSVVMIKDANELIDINKIACMGVPGFFRFYDFWVVENLIDGNVSPGWGSVIDPSKEVMEKMGIKHDIGLSWASSGEQRQRFLSNLIDNIDEVEAPSQEQEVPEEMPF